MIIFTIILIIVSFIFVLFNKLFEAIVYLQYALQNLDKFYFFENNDWIKTYSLNKFNIVKIYIKYTNLKLNLIDISIIIKDFNDINIKNIKITNKQVYKIREILNPIPVVNIDNNLIILI